MAVVSSFDEAIKTAGERLSASEFGGYLRSHHPAVRGNSLAGPWGMFTNAELSFYPTLVRAELALRVAESQGWALTASESAYLGWVRTQGFPIAHRIACGCWGDIDAELRQLVLDVDELPTPQGTFPGLRAPCRGRSLRSCGLDDRAIGPLRELWRAVGATDCYAVALREARRARSRGDVLQQVVAARARFGPRWPVGMPAGEATEVVRGLLDELYAAASSGTRSLVLAIRAHHQLVTAVLCAVLGYADRHYELAPLHAVQGPVRVSQAIRSLQAHVTLIDVGGSVFVHLTEPFEIAMHSPIDGVYTTTRAAFQFSGAEIVDLRGSQVRALTAGPML